MKYMKYMKYVKYKMYRTYINLYSYFSGFVSDNPSWVKPTLSSLGIGFAIISFSTVYIYASEVFPTVLRNVGVGSSSMFARVGSMIAPFIANLTFGYPWIPPVIFGSSMVAGALLCVVLPETLNCRLPESIEDVENFEKRGSKMIK